MFIFNEKYLDIGWQLVANLNSYFIDFKAYRVLKFDDGKHELAYYDKNMQFVFNIEEAEPDITGYLKWDGCFEIKIDSHFCNGKQDFLNINMLLNKIMELSLKLDNVERVW